MSSLKKLKKLKKKHKKLTNKISALLPKPHENSVLNEIAQDVALKVVVELSVPLRPLLSWFELDGNHCAQPVSLKGKKTKLNEPRLNSLLYMPLKSPPCKSCPARKGGICKCARKKFAN